MLLCSHSVSVGEVNSLFSLMSPPHLLGVVEEQTSYYSFLTGATSHPRKVQQSPSSLCTLLKLNFQGINSGVVLFDLVAMRLSEQYR